MSHGTEQVGGLPLTSDEVKTLIALMKHPDIRKLAQEMKDKDNE